MGSFPLVSIVIPCYNQASFLGESIESALHQTHSPCEVIVIDDGSQDETSGVAARYPQVRCLRQANAGLSAARNSGIRISRGDYLVFLDADDRLLPDAVERGLACLVLNPSCAFVSGHYRYIHADGSLKPEYPQEPLATTPYRALLQRNYIGMHATVLYRRAIFDVVGGFDPGLRSCEDYDMYFRVARTHAVCRHDGIVAEYRIHQGGMSIDASTMLRTAMQVLCSQWRYIRESEPEVRAFRSGVRYLRGTLCLPLLDTLSDSVRQGAWARALVLLRGLAGYVAPWFGALRIDLRLSASLASKLRLPADVRGR